MLEPVASIDIPEAESTGDNAKGERQFASAGPAKNPESL